MDKELVLKQIYTDLNELCINVGNRHVGSSGNLKAAMYAANRLASSGFKVTKPEFNCIDWEKGEIVLKSADESIEAFISPYSPSCDFERFFETVNNIEELERKDFSGKIAVFHGEICKEQIMPKNFVFYNPDGHKRINQILDEKKPVAVIAITSHNPELAGGQYPFPLFEDGDFNIPSAFLTEEEGAKLLSHKGSKITLKIESQRIPSKGFNVIGHKDGYDNRKIVFCAHIDAKKNTPGALDNATGVTTLFALADNLENYAGKYQVEILLVNGEDYYAAPGQMSYISENQLQFEQIVLAINIDCAGYSKGKTGYCCLECNSNLSQIVDQAFENNQQFMTSEPWYQSDHGWFIQYGVPAVAVTSENFMELTTNVTHTPKDSIEKVDSNKLYEIVFALRELINLLNTQL